MQELEAHINKVRPAQKQQLRRCPQPGAAAWLRGGRRARRSAPLSTVSTPFSIAGLQVIEDYKEKLQLRTDHHMG